MIVSHRHRFIFVKTYKVGGTSLEIALSKHCGAEDVIGPLEPAEEEYRRRVLNVGPQNHHRNGGLADRVRKLAGLRRPPRFHEHMPAWQIRRAVGADVWERYFTFTIVRNPFDRCVSRFFHCARYEAEKPEFEVWDHTSFAQFVAYRTEMLNENWRVYTANGAPIVDFCVRYERMEADLAEVSRRIGFAGNIYDEMKGIRMKGGIRPDRRPYADIISPRCRELISTLCAEEMRLFDYRFDERQGADEGADPVTGEGVV